MSSGEVENLFFFDHSGSDNCSKEPAPPLIDGDKNDQLPPTTGKKGSRKRNKGGKLLYNTVKANTSLQNKADSDLERIVFGDHHSASHCKETPRLELQPVTFTISTSPDEGVHSDDEDFGMHTILKKKKPAWQDEDDEDLSFALQEKKKLRKLRRTEDENNISGIQFEQRLRSQFEKLVGNPKWAERREEDREAEGNLTSTAADLRGKALHLPTSIIDIQQLREVNAGKRYSSSVNAAEFHPSSKVVLTSASGNTFDLYQVTSNGSQKIQTVYLEKFPIRCAHFASSGDEVIVTSNRKFYYAYDMRAGKVTTIHGIRGHREKSLDLFSASPDGSYLAFRGAHGHIHLLSGKTKQWIHSFKMNSEVKNIVFIPGKNQIVSSGGTGEVYLWDIRARRCLHKFQDDGCIRATSLAVSPNAQFFACGSNSGVVNIYDDNCLRERLPKPLKSVMNLTTTINRLAFNPTSEILAISSNVGKEKLKLLHTPTMTVFQNWPSTRTKLGHVECTDFSPHGGYMTAGNNKGFVKLFRLHHYPDA